MDAQTGQVPEMDGARGPASGKTATRVWWSAVVAVCLAGALLVGGVAVAGAVRSGGSAPAPASADGAPAGSTGMTGGSPAAGSSSAAAGTNGMAGMGGTAASGGGTATATTTGSSLCPNVQGATVMSNGMVMAPVPSTPPTPAQQAAAAQLVSEVEQGITQYSNLQTAEADGYEPLSSRNGPMTHYMNRSVVEQGAVLDPSHPSALMFANTVDGPVLIGAMFLGPGPCQPGPDIGGSLTQWHAHDNLCMSSGKIVGRAGSSGTCSVGTLNTKGYFMLHVWTAPQLAAKYQFKADLPPSAYAAIDSSGQA
jgi:hypothetical protein